MKEDKQKLKLVYPKEEAEILLDNVDDNRKEELDDHMNRR